MSLAACSHEMRCSKECDLSHFLGNHFPSYKNGTSFLIDQHSVPGTVKRRDTHL